MITISTKTKAVLLICLAAILHSGITAAEESGPLPKFTIQVDAFDSLVEAVEYGYELPFADNAVGVAKFRQGSREIFVLAVGTFQTALDAQNTMDLVCADAGLGNCRVRYLGDLENINATASAATVADTPPYQPEAIIEPEPVEEPIEVVVEEGELSPQPLALLVEDESNAVPPVQLYNDTDEQRFEQSLEDLSPEESLKASFDELVYTVQISAAFEREGLKRMARKLPPSNYVAEIIPTIGGKGNKIYILTAGRFAFKDDAQVYADDACAALGADGCWVKPLALIKPVDDNAQIADSAPVDIPALPPPNSNDAPVYTVQVAAYYDVASSERLAAKIPSYRGEPEINPFIGGKGNLVYGVTIGRFAYKDEAQDFADDVCDEIRLRGCWVKPLAMMRQEQEDLPLDMDAFIANMPKNRDAESSSKKKVLVNLADTGIRYTVQIAAVSSSDSAYALASQIDDSDTEVVPIQGVDGDVLYSVIVGRFDDRDEGQFLANSICERLQMSGCWVKPVDLIEKARVIQ